MNLVNSERVSYRSPSSPEPWQSKPIPVMPVGELFAGKSLQFRTNTLNVSAESFFVLALCGGES